MGRKFGKQKGAVGFRGGSFFVSYRLPSGKQVSKRGFGTEKEARDYLDEQLDEMRHQLRKQTYKEPQKIIFEKFAKHYLDERISIRASTLSGYMSINQKHLTPYFGKMRLQDIRFENVQDFVISLEEDFSPKTIRNCYGLLRTMLAGEKGKTAIRQGYISHDPMQGVELPRKEENAISPIVNNEVWALMKAAEQFGTLAQSVVYLGAFTGARRGELLALRFLNINWESKEVLIDRAVTRIRAKDGIHKWDWKLGETKTKSSVRRVIVSDAVLDYLKRMRNTAKNPDGFIFANAQGEFINPDYLDVLFEKIRTKANLPQIRLHDLRHFFASFLIDSNFNAQYVRDQLGHSSIKMTFDVYGHLFQRARLEAPSRLQEGMKLFLLLNSVSDSVSGGGEFERKESSGKLLN